ncbi:MAG TPA: DUF2752 domain-containing protein [Polyangiaceae bacterium]|nr:DUF2752 domain-containing protein [Polyangiaceae bacterium]
MALHTPTMNDSPMSYAQPPQPLPIRRRIARASLYVVVLAAFAGMMLSGVFQCPVARLTHHPCPGCGSTRAVRALLSLDFGAAFRFNPAAPLVAACIGALALEGLWLVARDGDASRLAMRPPGSWALRALVVAMFAQFVIWGLRFLGLFGGPVPV